MPFVVDASIIAAWALGEPDDRVTEIRARLQNDNALAPSLWWYEVRNALIQNERRQRLTESDTAAFLTGLSELGITLDHSPDEATVIGLSRRHRLTAYDAAYLELAMREGLPLATLDRELIQAARAENVSLVGQ